MLLSSPQGHSVGNDMTDKELVDAFHLTKEVSYFNELFNRYAHLVYGLCMGMVRDSDLCKDLVMVVFTQAYQSMARQEVKHVASWLQTIARNECLSHLRKSHFPLVSEDQWEKYKNSASFFMENDPSQRLTIEHKILLDNQLEEAIAKLNYEQRICIQLFFFEHKSYKEIVQMTGYPENQVKSYLQNGKRQLRLALEHMKTKSE